MELFNSREKRSYRLFLLIGRDEIGARRSGSLHRFKYSKNQKRDYLSNLHIGAFMYVTAWFKGVAFKMCENTFKPVGLVLSVH